MRAGVSILVMFFAVAISACKKNDKTPDKEEPKLPGKSLLLFPAQNSACTTANVNSAAQSTVTFNWVPAENTDKYTVSIKNLVTGITADTTIAAATVKVKLLNATPYSWFVTAKSSNTTTTTPSDTWRFYVPGPGELYFAPYPATITSPVFNQSVAPSVVNLQWTGSDPDNDITGYDVYFGTASDPTVYRSNITGTFLNGLAITSGTKYYWKIVTRDSKGNTSSSGVYQFTVR